MIKLKAYQNDAVHGLVKQIRVLLECLPGKVCVFKAPTGAGKTIMIADMLRRLGKEDKRGEYVFLWASLYDLHSQSKAKLTDFLRDTHYNLLGLHELTSNAMSRDNILFVNWHSLTNTKMNIETKQWEWSNIYVKEREDGRSIVEVLDKTREAGRQIILIVDEAHRNYLAPNSRQFIEEIIKPQLTIEVSATPPAIPNAEDIFSKKAGYVSVPFDKVVDSGLIKQETIINQEIGQYVNVANSEDELVIEAALAKRAQLSELYRQNNIPVNPLLLIQLPSTSKKTSVLDKNTYEEVERRLALHNITRKNKKLAVWLAEEKENLEQIEDNTSNVEVLIFKEAIAVGWDCPRAQIIVMLRNINSITFEIQTVGRILRTPEAKHYSVPTLNKAFVYTNIDDINICNNPESLDFFKDRFVNKKIDIHDVELSSVYLHRQDYGDLRADFSNILIECLCQYFDITHVETRETIYAKVGGVLELHENKLMIPVLADVIVHNLDAIQDEIGALNINKVRTNVSISNVESQFNYILKVWCLPYAPARSISKIKMAIYRWFEYLGYDRTKWTEVQRIVSCSRKNQIILGEIIETAKFKYQETRDADIVKQKPETHSVFNLPATDMFGEYYNLETANKYPYKQCYLRKDRSEPERYLEQMLEDSERIEWWYKNGEGKQRYFAISYETKDEETRQTKLANFYPDYIVRYTDGRIGIYDTKAGYTIRDQRTYDKSNALQEYISSENSRGAKLMGAILNRRKDGIYAFADTVYTPDVAKWCKFKI